MKGTSKNGTQDWELLVGSEIRDPGLNSLGRPGTRETTP